MDWPTGRIGRPKIVSIGYLAGSGKGRTAAYRLCTTLASGRTALLVVAGPSSLDTENEQEPSRRVKLMPRKTREEQQREREEKHKEKKETSNSVEEHHRLVRQISATDGLLGLQRDWLPKATAV